MHAIEIDTLSKSFGSKLAVDRISLKIQEGEFLGFIGPNGAGKTTTMNMLLNFIFPSSGSAKILGKSITRDSKQIRSFTGFMSSEDFLYESQSGWVNLKYVAALKKVPDAAARIRSIADTLDLDLKKQVRKLSKGNRRKVSLIAAILNRPRVLIMDEISTGLDPVVKAHTFDFLKELNRKEGTTVFFSSHVLSEVEDLCQSTAFIKQGRLIRHAQVEELGRVQFVLEIPESDNFAKVEQFLQEQHKLGAISQLQAHFPLLEFQSQDSSFTQKMEEMRIFRLLGSVSIQRESLEETVKSDYL